MRRHLSRWHRRIGLLSLLMLGWLSVTGLMLNHESALGLDQPLDTPWLARWYGLESDCRAEAWSLGTLDMVACDGIAFLDGRAVLRGHTLTGAVMWNDMVVAAGDKGLTLLTPAGELVERLDASLLPGTIAALGTADARLVLRTGAGQFATDIALETWTNHAGPVDWTVAAPIAEARREQLAQRAAVHALTGTRLLQDLHSGRFFGRIGQALADLGAISILVLAALGLILTRRGGRA